MVDFFTTLRILLRRWYVVLPTLLVAGAAAYYTVQTIPASYEATGTLVLLGPAKSGEPVPGEPPPAPINPFLELGGSLDVTGDVLTKVMLSDGVVARVAKQGGTAPYEVGTGSDGGSPIMNIVATGPDDAEAQNTVKVVAAELAKELQQRQEQAGSPPSQFIRFQEVSLPTKSKALLGSKFRAGAVVAALGLMLTFALAFLVDGIAERRSGRRSRRNAVINGGQPAVVPGSRTQRPGRPGAPTANLAASAQLGKAASPTLDPKPSERRRTPGSP
jgi:hypothetical protein